MMNLPFSPGATAAGQATTTSSRITLGEPLGNQVHVSTLAADSAVHIKFGDSTVVATVAAGLRINPGQTQIFTVPATATHCAVITASGTAEVSLTSGIGD